MAKASIEQTKVKKSTKPRKIKQPTYKSLRLSKKIKHESSYQISSTFKIFKMSVKVIISNWKIFLGIILIYGLLTIILVRGTSSINLSELKNGLTDALGGSYNNLSTATTLIGYLVSSSGTSSSAVGSLYQTILMIIVSLAIIWALRQVLANATIRVRDSFYNGMYPLIQFVLVLFVIGLQLVPLLSGAWLFSTIVSNGIAITLIEQLIWGLLFFFATLLSFYMVSSSLFAIYIVTLPEMTPMKALRSARQLVLNRRWTVLRKILFLPIILLIVVGIIMIPFVLYWTAIAVWVFFVISMSTLVIVHAYMYTLYRELLK